jgi:hypothetical protein
MNTSVTGRNGASAGTTTGTTKPGSSAAAGTTAGTTRHGSSLAATGTTTGTNTGAGSTGPGRSSSLATGVAGATQTNPTSVAGNQYTYGSGSGARPWRAYGYGSGYRNRYYGRRYGYGRSQGSNRGVIARLRSVQMQLARIDHDYQGHRVRAMQSVAMAIRQLSHRSMIYSGVGFSGGTNNGRGMGRGMGTGMGTGRGGLGGGTGRMPQAQSDGRMSHALRTLQGVNMQLGSQGGSTMGQGRARGHVMHAIRELGMALSIR